ncbi:hypothetical protein MTO96_008035 [Rhipicephalus appendiculatus]
MKPTTFIVLLIVSACLLASSDALVGAPNARAKRGDCEYEECTDEECAERGMECRPKGCGESLTAVGVLWSTVSPQV